MYQKSRRPSALSNATRGSRQDARSERAQGEGLAEVGHASPLPAFDWMSAVQRSQTDAAAAMFAEGARSASQEVPYRPEMESAFGQSFRGVQAHLGRRSSLARLHPRAGAATHGESVIFASRNPSRRLVAHELAHVAQNRKVGGGLRSGLSRPGDAADQEAASAADTVAGGGRVEVAAAPTAGVQMGFLEGSPGHMTVSNKAQEEARKLPTSVAEVVEKRKEEGLHKLAGQSSDDGFISGLAKSHYVASLPAEAMNGVVDRAFGRLDKERRDAHEEGREVDWTSLHEHLINDIHGAMAGVDDGRDLAAEKERILGQQLTGNPEGEVGISADYAKALQHVAGLKKEVIGVRDVNKEAMRLLSLGAASKDFTLKGKSGQYGFIPVDQNFSKYGVKVQGLHEELQKAEAAHGADSMEAGKLREAVHGAQKEVDDNNQAIEHLTGSGKFYATSEDQMYRYLTGDYNKYLEGKLEIAQGHGEAEQDYQGRKDRIEAGMEHLKTVGFEALGEHELDALKHQAIRHLSNDENFKMSAEDLAEDRNGKRAETLAAAKHRRDAIRGKLAETSQVDSGAAADSDAYHGDRREVIKNYLNSGAFPFFNHRTESFQVLSKKTAEGKLAPITADNDLFGIARKPTASGRGMAEARMGAQQATGGNSMEDLGTLIDLNVATKIAGYQGGLLYHHAAENKNVSLPQQLGKVGVFHPEKGYYMWNFAHDTNNPDTSIVNRVNTEEGMAARRAAIGKYEESLGDYRDTTHNPNWQFQGGKSAAKSRPPSAVPKSKHKTKRASGVASPIGQGRQTPVLAPVTHGPGMGRILGGYKATTSSKAPSSQSSHAGTPDLDDERVKAMQAHFDALIEKQRAKRRAGQPDPPPRHQI